MLILKVWLGIEKGKPVKIEKIKKALEKRKKYIEKMQEKYKETGEMIYGSSSTA